MPITYAAGGNATPAANTIVDTETTTTLNGATVSSRETERVLLAHRTGVSTVTDLRGQQGAANSIPVVQASNVAIPTGSPVLGAGSANIGGVDIRSAIQAGSANIGGVDIRSAIQAGENYIGFVGGKVVTREAFITRPANTTTYAAGDVVGPANNNEIAFGACARVANGTGTIRQVTMVDSASKVPAPVLELWFWNDAPSKFSDNTNFSPTDTAAASCVGVATLTANYQGLSTIEAGGNLFFQANNLGIDFVCTSGTNLWGTLVIRNTYAPVSSETFRLGVTIAQD